VPLVVPSEVANGGGKEKKFTSVPGLAVTNPGTTLAPGVTTTVSGRKA